MPAQLFLRCLRWYLDPGPLPSPVTILANAPLTAKRTANRGYTDAIARNGIRVKPMANQYPLRSIQQAVAHAGRSIRGGKINRGGLEPGSPGVIVSPSAGQSQAGGKI